MVVFLQVKNFMDKLQLNLVLRIPFVQLQHCDKLLQNGNVFQLLINLFTFAPIS